MALHQLRSGSSTGVHWEGGGMIFLPSPLPLSLLERFRFDVRSAEF